MSIGVDSMVLIYAGIVPVKPGIRTKEFEELAFRAKLLLAQLSLEKATVLLPTAAISELLVPVPKNQHGLLIAKLQEKFVCPTFDVRAASVAADLWAKHKSLPADCQYRNRQVVRADAMIIASAVSAGATEFYSHDKGCRALANLVLAAKDLPTRGDDLFIEGEIRRGEI